MRRKDQSKIDSIKRSVLKIIFEYGFKGSSVSKIAKEAKVSPATLYIYYENKEHMFEKIYEEIRSDMYDSILSTFDFNQENKITVKKFCESYYNYIVNHEQEFYFIKQYGVCPVLGDQESQNDVLLKLNEWVTNLKEENAIKSINNKIIFSLLLLPVEGLAKQFLLGRISYTMEELDQIYEMIWNGISK